MSKKIKILKFAVYSKFLLLREILITNTNKFTNQAQVLKLQDFIRKLVFIYIFYQWIYLIKY